MRDKTAIKMFSRHSPDFVTGPLSSPTARPGQYHSFKPKKLIVHLPEFLLATPDKDSLRQCCKIKQEIRQIISHQAKARRRRVTSRSTAHHQSVGTQPNESPKKRHSHTAAISQKGKKVYLLPRLKQFQGDDIIQEETDNETKHKTLMREKPTRVLTEGIQSMLPRLKPSRLERHKCHDQHSQTSRAGNQSYIDASPFIQKRQMTNQKSEGSNTSASRPYYKYIENYSGSKGLSQDKKKLSDEDSLCPSSSFEPRTRKDNSTIFHTNKLKYGHQKQLDHKMYLQRSVRPLPSFPKTEEELEQFLINYQPLQDSFNLKEIIKTSNFEVLAEEDRVYFGQWQQRKRHGKGILLTPKELYEGEFKNDEKTIGAQKNNVGVYCGQFKGNKRHGQGFFKWDNGEYFEGQWKEGKKQGYGMWKSPKGNRYEGEWKNSKQNGKGLYVHVGGSKYIGYFKDFLKDGKGEEQFSNGDKYNGQYKQGKPHGFGKYSWANGDIYSGEFAKGSREGQGLLIMANGDSYEGFFQGDLKHGPGKQKYVSGQYFQGTFELGQKVEGRLFSKAGLLLQQI